jgi:exo-1,4-beta-D-glucosaminidase
MAELMDRETPHMRSRRRSVFGALALLALLLACTDSTRSPAAASPRVTIGSIGLTDGWALRAADEVTDPGDTIATVGYPTTGWNPVTLPSTVLAGLVADGVYPDIYRGTNLADVPDLTKQQWWYRGEFDVPPAGAGQRVWLRFEGISYRAQIWMNGVELDPDAEGAMVDHEYDVTDVVEPGATNAVAVLVTPPRHRCKDLSFCTVDWNPEAPDMNAGLWGVTLLEMTGPVALRDPYVRTELPLPRTDSADLTVYVDAVNGTDQPVTTSVDATIDRAGHDPITLAQTVTLDPYERREVVFDTAMYPALHVEHPDLWWPYQFGTPALERLSTTASVAGATSDRQATRFGIRQFTDARQTVRGTSFVRYFVNGRPILIRGGGYMWDLLQRLNPRDAATTVAYTKAMGLNTIRLEGTVGNQALYQAADRAGVMIMPGFVCCSIWQNDQRWTPTQVAVAAASVDSQMRALRAHASAFMWAFGSDCPVDGQHLRRYKRIAARLHWQNPTVDGVATWCDANAGMKMDGPYAWVPPVLWWDTGRAGSAFGTTAEEGTQTPPPLETLRGFLPPTDRWPIDHTWNVHAGRPGSTFDTFHWTTDAIDRRYGRATGFTDYSGKAELQNYETARSFFEAWNAHEFDGCAGRCATFGTIYWMLNAGWPSMNWNLFPSTFQPGGAFFGTQTANEPVHIAYDYATRQVDVTNSTLQGRSGLTATATAYDVPDLRERFSFSVPNVDAPANASEIVFRVPPVRGGAHTYFLRLQLRGPAGRLVSDNLYWYSTHPDVLGDHHSWFRTPVNRYANLSGLQRLPTNAEVTAVARSRTAGDRETVHITIHNESPTDIAFFVRASIMAGRGEVLPIRYSHNDVSLFPGESTTITARYRRTDLGGAVPRLTLGGYNVPEQALSVG